MDIEDQSSYRRNTRSSIDSGNGKGMLDRHVNSQRVYVDTPIQLPLLDNSNTGGVEVGRQVRGGGTVRRPRQTVFEYEGVTQASGSGRFPAAFCELERDNGIICTGIRRGVFLEQFYYDSESNRCAHFVYNGCGNLIITGNQIKAPYFQLF